MENVAKLLDARDPEGQLAVHIRRLRQCKPIGAVVQRLLPGCTPQRYIHTSVIELDGSRYTRIEGTGNEEDRTIHCPGEPDFDRCVDMFKEMFPCGL